MTDSGDIPPDDRTPVDRWYSMPLRELAGEVYKSSIAFDAPHRHLLQMIFETRLAEASIAAAEASQAAAGAGERTAFWTRLLALATFALALATVGLVVVEVSK